MGRDGGKIYFWMLGGRGVIGGEKRQLTLSRHICSFTAPTSDQSKIELNKVLKGCAHPGDAQYFHTMHCKQYELEFYELDFEHSETLPGKSSKVRPSVSS